MLSPRHSPCRLLYCLFLIAALPGVSTAQDLAPFEAKVAQVIDGDTFDLEDGRRVRLMGISAPEWDETGGAEATAGLRALAEGRTVECRPNGEISHRRVVARCFRMGEDLGRRLVQVGLARDCPRHSGGLYAPDETPGGRRLPLPGYCRLR